MKETNLIQSMTNIKKIRLFNNSLLYGIQKYIWISVCRKRSSKSWAFFEKCGKIKAVIK